jgi:hypothetical protein
MRAYPARVDAVQRFFVGVRLIVRQHSARVWLLWALAALLLLLTPFALMDPAAWVFLLDPELAAIVALLGFASLRAGAFRLVAQPLLALSRLSRRDSRSNAWVASPRPALSNGRRRAP